MHGQGPCFWLGLSHWESIVGNKPSSSNLAAVQQIFAEESWGGKRDGLYRHHIFQNFPHFTTHLKEWQHTKFQKAYLREPLDKANLLSWCCKVYQIWGKNPTLKGYHNVESFCWERWNDFQSKRKQKNIRMIFDLVRGYGLLGKRHPGGILMEINFISSQ